MRSLPVTVCLSLVACGQGTQPPDVTTTRIDLRVDAGTVTTLLAPLWRDHYDLSAQHFRYTDEPGFLEVARQLQPRSWRCSVGRWEVGLPPPGGGDSRDVNVLRTCEREFYRGSDTLAAADDPANYHFAYLDAQLTAIAMTGAVPYLCFDYMPFTLSSEQDPNNPDNLSVPDPILPWPRLSFSNGIRTAPPRDPAVYARVVHNTIRHVRGQFAGTLDFGITDIEIGNEPDLYEPDGTPLRIFWTGTRAQWLAMYAAIAAEVTVPGVRLGGGSFAFQPGVPTPTFLQDFLVDVVQNGRRLDFLSFHSYSDDPLVHVASFAIVDALRRAAGLNVPLVNAEWGRALDGDDPVYDRIEHGLLRSKVMMAAQIFGIQIAHEALLRDIGPGRDLLGLIKTQPAGPKPVSDCYRALLRFGDATDALAVTVPAGQWVLAARNPGANRVVVAVVADDPGATAAHRYELTIDHLPFAGAAFDVHRFEVSEATFAAGMGPRLAQSSVGSGNSIALAATVGPGPGAGTLLLWELVAR